MGPCHQQIDTVRTVSRFQKRKQSISPILIELLHVVDKTQRSLIENMQDFKKTFPEISYDLQDIIS